MSGFAADLHRLTRPRLAPGLALACVLLLCPPRAAAEGFIESVVYDAEADSIQVTLACAVRYLHHDQQTVDKTLKVQLLGLDGCRGALDRGIGSLSLAKAGETLLGVQYQNQGQEISVSFNFIENGRFFVSQGSDARSFVLSKRRHLLDVAVEPVAASLNRQQADSRLKQARGHMLDGDYEAAAAGYTQLLEQADESAHMEALEYLALAYERSGRPGLAAQRYELWLQRFDEPTAAARVQQRLDALVASAAEADTAAAPAPAQGRWDMYASISQDVWSLSAQGEYAGVDLEDVDRTVMLTYVDAGAGYSGGGYDIRTHVSLGYQNTLNASSSSDRDDEPFARRAYVEYLNNISGWRLRAGRQITYGDGILGAYDGLRTTFRVTDDIRVNVTAGLPVDNPRYAAETDRQFVAASMDVDNFLFGFDANFYTHQQQNDGLWDRQAVGSQWRRAGQNWYTVARLDYDVSYEVLNSALIEAGGSPRPWLRAHSRINFFTSPYVGTGNALIGQSAVTLDELQQFYTEAQLRALARNRTTDVQQFTLGASMDLSPRWTADVNSTYSGFDATVASAGVAAEPDTEQIDTSVLLRGGSIFRAQDVLQLGYNLFSQTRADTHSLRFDWRFRWTDKFRLNPRLAVAKRFSDTTGDQLILTPALQLTYLPSRKYRISAEVSGRWSDRNLPANDPFLLGLTDMTEENLELYFYLQWRADF